MKTVMKNKKVIGVVAAVVLAVALLATGVIASPPMGAGDPPVESKINYQGQLTDSGGNPLNGTYDMEFRFYNAVSGGSQVGSTITESGVQVTEGLFNVKLDVDQSDFNGQGLWLQMRVRPSGGSWDSWMYPRQEILPVPYALSLKPGAVIGGAGAGDGSIYLKDANDETVLVIGTDLDRAYVDIGGLGNAGSIWVRDGNDEYVFHVGSAGGIVDIGGLNEDGDIWVRNAAEEITFDVSGDTGRIKSAADSYIFMSGTEFIKDLDTHTTRWDCQANGAVRIWRGATAGHKYIYVPVTVPGVLYGQKVTVEELTIYYMCQDGTKNYIMNTFLFKQTDADSYATIVSDTTDRTSNTATSYSLSLTQNNVLSSDQGILSLQLGLNFADDTNYIQIGGARLRLGHAY